MVELKLQEHCYNCDKVDINVRTENKKQFGFSADDSDSRKITISCEHEEICKYMVED